MKTRARGPDEVDVADIKGGSLFPPSLGYMLAKPTFTSHLVLASKRQRSFSGRGL